MTQRTITEGEKLKGWGQPSVGISHEKWSKITAKVGKVKYKFHFRGPTTVHSLLEEFRNLAAVDDSLRDFDQNSLELIGIEEFPKETNLQKVVSRSELVEF
jgi:hypothetical protein